MEQLISKYLRDINLPISRKYCEKLIASHPDYPSMLSIADTLQRLGIRHKAARIEKDYLNKLEYPYLLWPEEEGGEPKIVRDEQDVPANGTHDPSNNEAREQTIILKAEPTDTLADPENNRQRSQDRFLRILTGVLVAAAGGLILLNILSILNWVYIALLLTALAGAVVGYLLIAKDVGINYKPVEAFCRAGKKTNCDALLNSEAARLFGDKVSFSDAVASYFLFQLLVAGFLFPSGGASFLWILAILSVLTVPVIGYSLWYQALETKTWCRLCLIVDGILTIQVALFGYILFYDSLAGTGYPGLNSLAVALLLFGAVGSAVLLLKHKIKDASRSEQAAITAKRIKHSPEVFMYLLRREKRVDTMPFEQELFMGNPDATIKILMAASLGCGPCKEGFEQASGLVAAYPQHVHLSIRLRMSGRSNGDITPGIVLLRHWQQHIHGEPNASEHTEQLIRDWYILKDFEGFISQYPLDRNNGNNGDIEQLEDLHAQWMEKEEISATPTFFINGYQLPRAYQIDDLMGIMPSLVDHIEQREIKQKTLATDEELAVFRKYTEHSNKG